MDVQTELASSRDDWRAAAASEAFQSLLRTKRGYLGPMLGGALAMFLGVMLLAGYARPFMARSALGPLNNGYLLIFGLYAMCWAIAIAYARLADRVFDPAARRAAAAIGEPRA